MVDSLNEFDEVKKTNKFPFYHRLFLLVLWVAISVLFVKYKFSDEDVLNSLFFIMTGMNVGVNMTRLYDAYKEAFKK